MKFMKPKYLALFVAAAVSPVFAAVPGVPSLTNGNDKFAIVEVNQAAQDYNNLDLPKSQNVIGRLISFGIRCTWTEEQVKELAAKISESVTKALATAHA